MSAAACLLPQTHRRLPMPVASSAFHDALPPSATHSPPVEMGFDDERWPSPPPAAWLLLALTTASLAPLFLALLLAASLP